MSNSNPHPTEADERARLTHVTGRIHDVLMDFDARVRSKRSEALAIICG